MKLLFIIVSMLGLKIAYAGSEDILVDTFCAYTCQYKVEIEYDSVYEQLKEKTFFANQAGVSLEQVLTSENVVTPEMMKTCIENTPSLNPPFESKNKSCTIAKVKCVHFKH